MITFDDGYETGLYYVLPLLKKYGMKAVINVVGSYTDEYSRINEEGKHLSYAYLTWNEIKTLSDSGYVEIGNHTYDMHSNNGDRNGCTRKKTRATSSTARCCMRMWQGCRTNYSRSQGKGLSLSHIPSGHSAREVRR